MKRILLVCAILAMLLVPLIPIQVVAAPVQIGTTTDTYPLYSSYTGGKTFWCNGRHWAIWYDGTHQVWSSSSDNGVTWAATANLMADGFYGSQELSVWCDSDNQSIHITYSNGWDAAPSAIWYRKGGLNSDGTITWADVAQTAVAGGGSFYNGLSIITLQTGEPVIGYLMSTAPGLCRGRPYITMSSTDNGLWTVAGGYPYQVSASVYAGQDLAPTSTGGFQVIYGSGTLAPIYGKYNDIGGGGWGGQQTIGNAVVGNSREFDITTQEDDTIHVVYREETSGHLHYRWKSIATGVWSSDVEVSTTYAMQFQISSLSDNNLIVSCLDETSDKGFYISRINGTWDSAWTELWDAGTAVDDVCASIPFNNYGTKWWMIYTRVAVGADPMLFEDIAGPTCTTGTPLPADAGVTKVTMYGTCNTTEGPEGVDVRFNYGLTAAYGDNTTWQNFATADNFSAYQTGLAASTTYHYRVEARNSFGWAYGIDKTFTTEASIDAPTMLMAVPLNASTVSLSWVVGDLASSSELRYSTTGYPAYGAGVELYSGALQSFLMDNATGGTTYYFSVWCWEVDEPVSTSDNAMATTPAGYSASTPPTGHDDSTGPSSTIIDASPIGGLVSWVSVYGQLPKTTVGILGYMSLLFFGLVAIAIYNRSVTVVVICAIAGLAIGHSLGLISFVFLVIAAIVGFGVSTLRGGQPTG